MSSCCLLSIEGQPMVFLWGTQWDVSRYHQILHSYRCLSSASTVPFIYAQDSKQFFKCSRANVFCLKWWVMISGEEVATQMAVLSSFLGWTINLNTHPTVSPKAKRALSAFWCQANDDASQTMLMDNYGFRNFQFSAPGDSTWYAWNLRWCTGEQKCFHHQDICSNVRHDDGLIKNEHLCIEIKGATSSAPPLLR